MRATASKPQRQRLDHGGRIMSLAALWLCLLPLGAFSDTCADGANVTVTVSGIAANAATCASAATALNSNPLYIANNVTFVTPWNCDQCVPDPNDPSGAMCNATLTVTVGPFVIFQLYADLWANPIGGTYDNPLVEIPHVIYTDPLCQTGTCGDSFPGTVQFLLGVCNGTATYWDSCGGVARNPSSCVGVPVDPHPAPKKKPLPSPTPSPSPLDSPLDSPVYSPVNSPILSPDPPVGCTAYQAVNLTVTGTASSKAACQLAALALRSSCLYSTIVHGTDFTSPFACTSCTPLTPGGGSSRPCSAVLTASLRAAKDAPQLYADLYAVAVGGVYNGTGSPPKAKHSPPCGDDVGVKQPCANYFLMEVYTLLRGADLGAPCRGVTTFADTCGGQPPTALAC